MDTLEGRWIYLVFAIVLGILILKAPLLLFAVGILFVLFYRKSKTVSILFLAVCLIGFVDALIHERVVPQKPQQETIAKVVTHPSIDGDFLSFVGSLQNHEKVLVTKRIGSIEEQVALKKNLYAGMTCYIKGNVKKPDPPGNFHQFNYPNYLNNKGIYYEVDATILQCEQTSMNILDHLRYIRDSGIQYIQRVYPDSLRGMVMALVFGDREAISSETLQAYQSLGLIHLLAVSGLHVGIIFIALFFILIRLGFTREKSSLFLILLLPSYIVLSGGAPSVFRAVLMTLVILLSQLFKKHLFSCDAMSWTFLILVIINPHFIFDLGFQLSYTVVFGILLSYPTINRRYQSAWQKLLFTSVVAQFSALPILLYNFYSFSLIGIILNVIYIPLISLIILPLSFLSFIVNLIFPFIGQWFITFLNIIVRYSNNIIVRVYETPFSSIQLGQPNIVLTLILSVILIMIFILWERKSSFFRRYIIPLALMTGFLLLQAFFPYMSSIGKVTFLDVGQGDAVLIELPHRAGVYLIDTGGIPPYQQAAWKQKKSPFSVGRDVILNELKAKGIHQIDRLILTHHDYDHIGGTKDLIGHIPIREILISDHYQVRSFDASLFQKARQMGSVFKTVSAGDHWNIQDNQFVIINPKHYTEKSNDRSIVIYANMGSLKWLFTGDLENTGEEDVLSNYPNLKVDILKVGHHGSASSTSTKLLSVIKPKMAVISVGKKNRYGHPTAITLKRLREAKVTILRTDQLGAIEFDYTSKNGVVAVKSAKK